MNIRMRATYMDSRGKCLCFKLLRVELMKAGLYLASRVLPYLCTKNETMAPLHVSTLRE